MAELATSLIVIKVKEMKQADSLYYANDEDALQNYNKIKSAMNSGDVVEVIYKNTFMNIDAKDISFISLTFIAMGESYNEQLSTLRKS